MLFLEKTRQQK